MPSDPAGLYIDDWSPELERSVDLYQGFLTRFRYKPGWMFEITRRMGCAAVNISLMVQDSRQKFSCNTIKVEGFYPIPGHITSEKEFFQHLRCAIRDVELHEMDEWFRIDGELPYDPHKTDWMLNR